MLKKIIFVVVGVCIVSLQAIAETREEELVRLSRITHSAFTCAVLASDTNNTDSERISNLGLTARRKFIDGMKTLDEDGRKRVAEQVSLLWSFYWHSPSADFLLGRIFEWQMAHEVFEKIKDLDKATQISIEKTMYREQNCMLIR
jgi:hypothetical protein